MEESSGTLIPKFMPKEDGCIDCGSKNIEKLDYKPFEFNGQTDVDSLDERHLQMAAHGVSIEPILSFYEDRGILIEWKLRDGFEGYKRL